MKPQRPQNEKSLFHFLCGMMEAVVDGSVDGEQVKSVCDLTREAEKLLRGERERVKLLMSLDEHERNFGKRPQLRELAAIGFDDTTKDPQTGNPKNDDASYCK